MKHRTYFDDMVDLFGYDYVIGYCLCQEYYLTNKASKEPDREKADKLFEQAKKYKRKADYLSRERIENGL